MRSYSIKCLYAQPFMDNNFNYINDPVTIAQLRRFNIQGSTFICLPIGRNGHWSLATVNTQARKIYHEDSSSGTHSDTGKDGASIMLQLLANVANTKGNSFTRKSGHAKAPERYTHPSRQEVLTVRVFVCAYATLRQQEYDTNLFH